MFQKTEIRDGHVTVFDSWVHRAALQPSLLLMQITLWPVTDTSERVLLHCMVPCCRYVLGFLLALLCIAKSLWCMLWQSTSWGTGIRGLTRGMATLSQGNQELLVVRDKVGRPPGELRVSKSMNVIFSLQCFDTVGWVTGRASGL